MLHSGSFFETECVSQHLGVKKLRGAAVVDVLHIGYCMVRHTMTDSTWQVVISPTLV